MSDIVIHHLDHSRSQRVLWLLEELELEYSIVPYARDPKTMRAPHSLRRVHPLGKSPVLEDSTGIVAESGAIVEHVVETYGEGRLRPAEGTEDRRRYRFFLHYAEGSLMPPLLVKLIFSRVRKAPLPFFLKPVARGIADKVDRTFTDPEISGHVSFLEAELAEREWFAGDELSGADIMMSFPVEAARARGAIGDAQPRLSAYLDRVHARPAYQRALERGGPFDIRTG